MGRMLLGVDLDESPVGGLVERLLSAEELEKLADGGQPTGTGDPGDDSGDDLDDSEDGPGESAGTADDDPLADLLDDTGADDFDGPDDFDGADRVRDPADADSGVGSRGLRERVGDAGPDLGGDSGWKSRLAARRSLLLKAAAVLALLAVLAVVAWRYAGQITGAVPDRVTDRLGGTSDDTGPADDGDAAVSPARQRAKVTGEPEVGASEERPGRTETDEETEWTTKAGAPWRRPRDAVDDDTERDDEPADAGVRSVGEDLDLGALVGLATLALIAALVRKFGEGRPRDPLVDGPEE